MKYAIFILIAVSSCALAETRVLYYPYDFASPTTNHLVGQEEGVELRAAEPRLLPDYACGAYRGSKWISTSGFILYFFPDRTAMIKEVCDVCEGELVAEGKWSIDGGSIHAS